MKKVLMLSTASSMIQQFNMSNISILQQLGYQVDVACNFDSGNSFSRAHTEKFKKELENINVRYYNLGFSRRPWKLFGNLRAYRQLLFLMRQNSYDFIHCHTPIAGAAGRLAGHRAGTKVMYTAHGFHFYDGAPLRNWLFYYPVERFLARYTDVLVTINHEDYAHARMFRAKKAAYIPGVGVDFIKANSVRKDRGAMRRRMRVPEDAFLLATVGELNSNKNQQLTLRALRKLRDPSVYFVMCGIGGKQKKLERMTRRYGLESHVRFLGYRSDIFAIDRAADAYISTSKREGLGVAVIEAMGLGVPGILSKNRGSLDILSEDGIGGLFFESGKAKQLANAIRRLNTDKKFYRDVQAESAASVRRFSIQNAASKMEAIYRAMSEKPAVESKPEQAENEAALEARVV